MLNLTQRLILGCVLMVGLIAGLEAVTHNALAAAGQLPLASLFVAAAAVIAVVDRLLCAAPHSHAGPRRPPDRPGQPGAPRGVEQPRQLRRDRQLS
jgi:hypothetical protein